MFYYTLHHVSEVQSVFKFAENVSVNLLFAITVALVLCGHCFPVATLANYLYTCNILVLFVELGFYEISQ